MPEEPNVIPRRPIEGELAPEQVLPTREPPGIRDGREAIDSDRYDGTSTWVTIGKPLVEVDPADLASTAVSVWNREGHTWVSVLLMMFRYIPYNPTYRGQLISLQGSWVEMVARTKAWAKARDLENNIETALEASYDVAVHRVVWLEAIRIDTFEHRADVPSRRDVMSRRLH